LASSAMLSPWGSLTRDVFFAKRIEVRTLARCPITDAKS